MVQTGVVDQSGFGRWIKYHLSISGVRVKLTAIEPNEEKIISFIKRHGSITNADCRDLLQANLHNTSYFVKKMTKKGADQTRGQTPMDALPVT